MTMQQRSTQLFNFLKFYELTPVQEKTYPLFMKGKDLVVQSATGTGKTHSFLFPLIDLVTSSKNQTQALIVLPTRELAFQVYQFCQDLKQIDLNLSIQLLVGGKDRVKMSQKIENQVHIAIGTPGRIVDLIKTGSLRIDQVKYFIVDEVDMIWEYGFMREVLEIFSRLNKNTQTLAFSATLKDQLISLLKKSMNQPEFIKINQVSKYNPNIHFHCVDQTGKKTIDIIQTILNSQQISGAIIFGNTREETQLYYDQYISLGYQGIILHGDLSPRDRKKAVLKLQNEQSPILFATDIAARGIDLPYVSTIISLGFPKQLDFFFHRAGRTGRIGKEGSVYVLVTKEDSQTVNHLMSMGLSFDFLKVKQDKLTEVQNFTSKKVYHKKVDPQIIAITSRKTNKVKPNYKKKRQAKVAKIVNQKRREMIRNEIKEQKKVRAKARMKLMNFD